MAKNNGVVIGADLHHMVKDIKDFKFKKTGEFSIGLKLSYPVYSVDIKY